LETGSLTITLIPDPDTCPDLSELRDVLEEEVCVLTGSTHQRTRKNSETQ